MNNINSAIKNYLGTEYLETEYLVFYILTGVEKVSLSVTTYGIFLTFDDLIVFIKGLLNENYGYMENEINNKLKSFGLGSALQDNGIDLPYEYLLVTKAPLQNTYMENLGLGFEHIGESGSDETNGFISKLWARNRRTNYYLMGQENNI